MVYYIDTPSRPIPDNGAAQRITHHSPVDVAIPLWTGTRYDQMMECIERQPMDRQGCWRPFRHDTA